MIEPPFRTPLVPSVGAPPLLEAGLHTASDAAIAMSAIAMRAEEENRVASLTHAKTTPENRFAMHRPHASSQAVLDNGSGFVAGWNQLCLVLPDEGCRTRIPVARTAG